MKLTLHHSTITLKISLCIYIFPFDLHNIESKVLLSYGRATQFTLKRPRSGEFQMNISHALMPRSHITQRLQSIESMSSGVKDP